jgi:hypothetical protein
MKNILRLILIVLLGGCATNQPLLTESTSSPLAVAGDSLWSVYDTDPDHPWNRVFRQLFRRTSADGQEFGAGELDPLLWFDTTYLMTGLSHRETLQVLDEFLSADADDLVRDPLKRAMFQRDLWAVFDWSSSLEEPYAMERKALQARLAEIMMRVALSKEEILALPDNYALAVKSAAYPAVFQEDQPGTAFLPADLLQPGTGWIVVGREGGPTAMTHTEAFPFFGRAVFFVFVRAPDGRAGTLEFIDVLNRVLNPLTPVGTQVALVRRMLLIDDKGKLVLSPLVETVQLRHFGPSQSFYEFEMDRKRLFDSQAGGLVPNDNLFILFMGHGDVFENPLPEAQAAIPQICKACHFETSPSLNSGATQSIISYSREPFPLPGNARPVLFASTVKKEALAVMEWKQRHATRKSLEALWTRANPK